MVTSPATIPSLTDIDIDVRLPRLQRQHGRLVFSLPSGVDLFQLVVEEAVVVRQIADVTSDVVVRSAARSPELRVVRTGDILTSDDM